MACPMSLVEKGDPYPRQIEETVRLTCEQGAQTIRRMATPRTSSVTKAASAPRNGCSLR